MRQGHPASQAAPHVDDKVDPHNLEAFGQNIEAIAKGTVNVRTV